jgi:hypothetical protein
MSLIRKNIQSAQAYDSQQLEIDTYVPDHSFFAKPIEKPTPTRKEERLWKARVLDKVIELLNEPNYSEIAIANQQKGIEYTKAILSQFQAEKRT